MIGGTVANQTVIQGNAFNVLVGLDPTFDLVIFDPPAELHPADLSVLLDHCYDLTTDEAGVFFYGLNPSTLVRITADTRWKIRRVFSLTGRNSGKFVGTVLYARKNVDGVNATIFENIDQRIPVWGKKGFGGHETTKPTLWFEWIFRGLWKNVLDPFAGLAPVGQICKDLEIDYTGVELDRRAWLAAQESIS